MEAMVLLTFFVVISLLQEVIGLINCDDVLGDSNKFTGQCDNKFSNLKPYLKPTQSQVGFAWIKYKLDKDFTSESDAQSAIDDSPTPAVIGPGPYLYIVDDHHTLCALDFSGYEDVKVTVNVLCDLRSLSLDTFWSTLQKQNLAYLGTHPANQPNGLPQFIPYSSLPSSFSFSDDTSSTSTKSKKGPIRSTTSNTSIVSSSGVSFTDDAWRSLAGYSRKVTEGPSAAPSCNTDKDDDSKYCERCMYRGCVDGYQSSGSGVAYFEFRWAYFMNDAAYYNPQYWASSNDRQAFLDLYGKVSSSSSSSRSSSSSGLLDSVDIEAWQELAVAIIPLCRSNLTTDYTLPSSIYPAITKTGDQLPGYYSGYTKLSDDPTCNSPVCSI